MKWRGTRDELKAALKLIPRVLSGKEADSLGAHDLFWRYVGNAVLEQIRDAFLAKMDGRIGSDGIKWAKLAAATIAKRRYAGRADRDILRETGELLASLEPGFEDVPSGVDWQVFRVEPDGVAVGTFEPKADRHQHGTEHMPARPIVRPDDPLPRRWEKPVEEAMEKALERVVQLIVRNGGW